MFNAIFNNISVILWRSVLLMEETGVPGENHRQTLSHNVVSCFILVKGLLFKVYSLCINKYINKNNKFTNNDL